MMVLEELVRLYESTRAISPESAPPFGWSARKVAWEVVIDDEGDVQDVLQLESAQGKRMRPWVMAEVPEQPSRSSGVAPYFLCDKGAYLFGLDEKRGDLLFEASRALHETVLAGVGCREARAVLGFFSRAGRAEEFSEEMRQELAKGGLCVFRLLGASQGEWVHARPEVADAWAAHRSKPREGEEEGQCSVMGDRRKLARLYPKVGGVPGAQSTGASLVSVNFPAGESYGREQAYNASISEYAAFASSTALQMLVSDLERRVTIGGTTLLFWGRPDDDGRAALLREALGFGTRDDGAADGVWRVAVNAARGVPAPDGLGLDEPFCVLGIAPRASRLAVRFFYRDTFGAYLRNLASYLDDTGLEGVEPVPLRNLLLQTAAQGDPKNLPQSLINSCVRSVLEGGDFPPALPRLLIRRMRADKARNKPWDLRQRAALFKGCLVRKQRTSGSLVDRKDEYEMSLNRENANPGYLLGRLFAVLEHAQVSALKPSATIADKYLASASSTPAHVFPTLMRGARPHLKTLKDERAWLALKLEREMEEILGADWPGCSLPRTLGEDEQMSFYLGYYQERTDLWKKKDGKAVDEQ